MFKTIKTFIVRDLLDVISATVRYAIYVPLCFYAVKLLRRDVELPRGCFHHIRINEEKARCDFRSLVWYFMPIKRD
ncbi:MAG: hypothetical protein HRU28_01320 [Rhizobiales bacterium]|nr:hypothetical protein [Hyphomicrobiales bacterium]